MSVFKRPGQSEFSYDFRLRGNRFSGGTGCTTRRAAEAYEDRVKEKAKAAAIDRAKPMTVGVATTVYWNEVGQFLANASDCMRHLAWIQNHFKRGTLLSKIGDPEIATAVAKRRAKGVTNATVNRTLTQPLRAILRRAKKTWKQATQDIEWKTHFLAEAQERVREATAEEEQTFTRAIRSDYEPAFRFAILTGCRRAEIVGLQWTAVDFFTRQFTVKGKRGKERTLPMTTKVFDLLWSLKGHHATAVFTYIAKRPRDGRKGERVPITIEGFKSEWRRTKGRAKVPNFKFHDTRHTAATRLVRSTGNLKQAQRLLGHTELATTSRYAHVTDDDLRAGLEASHTAKVTAGNAAEAPESTDKALKAK